MVTGNGKDQELEDYLQGKSALSGVYKASPSEEPPAKLDAAILAEAHKAVKQRPRATYSSFASNWVVPVSLAAVLLISVGLVTFMSGEFGVPKPASVATEPMMDAKPDSPGRMEREIRLGVEAGAARQEGLGVDDLSSQAVPLESKAVERPAPVLQAPNAKRRLKKESTPRKTGVLRSDMAEEAPAAATPIMEQDRMRTQDKADGRARTPMAAPAAGFAAEPKDLSPEEWLKHIAELKKQGRHKEAEESLKEFKKRYPDYPYPEDKGKE